MEYKKIKFPEDCQAHGENVEWWYFNGNLKDKSGNQYAFMNCLFQIKKMFKTLYFSHSLLSDIKNQKFYSRINPIVKLSKNSFSRGLLFVEYTANLFGKNWGNLIEQKKFNVYHVKTKDLDLMFKSTKKPLLEGGQGFVKLGTKKTYYYSLTNLETKGKIKVDGKWIEVVGKSWFDHQWSDVQSVKGMWSWFSIQLENNFEMVCFEYSDNGEKYFLASIIDKNGKQKHFNKVKFKPLKNKWKSKLTGSVYPLSWEIEIPEEKINLKVESLMQNKKKNQEMNFGLVNYFEGPIKVTGTINNKKVKGKGFMELVGYPTYFTKIKLMFKKIFQKF